MKLGFAGLLLIFTVSLFSQIDHPDSVIIHLQKTEPVTIIGTGDIMLGTNYPSGRYLPPGNDCSPLLNDVAPVLRSADVTFGNLEGVFCAEGGTPKKCRDTLNCYVFRMPDEYIECISEAGYSVLSVANNHVNDFGYEGRLSTAKVLEEAGIHFAGFIDHPYAIFEKAGLTFGFAAFAPHKGTMDLKNYQLAGEIAQMLDSIADIVIISFHGGAEGKDHQHVTKEDEEFLGYNRGNVYHFAHTVIDAGADVVFGHGPHVTRAIELYNERLICYSLGNFATYKRFNLRGPNGIAPIIKIRTTVEGEFIDGEIIPVYQPPEGGTFIDPEKRVIEKLQTLTGMDFPDQPVSIDDDGKIRRTR
ncbi:MAG TPA: CapA family protein [Bacteroidaceae bacterium]|nr:CapA family protein [Bacteroidaceae bacterium]